jgi:membrane protein implicated in regulation of membrane protease activity
MTESTLWWVLAGSVVAIELMTGTFYLLMLSLGFMAAALAAHAGLTIPGQLMVAAVFAGGSVLVGRRYRKKISASLNLDGAPGGNLDLGATVQVDTWRADGTSTVKYRGANWEVGLADGEAPSPGTHRIVKVVGSRLILKNAAKTQFN